MSCANRFGRAARFESLERRELLAGDVLVNVVRGDLLIQGDAEGNEIAITAGAERGSFVVTGLDGTTVHRNGQAPASEVTVSGVRGNVRINMGEGDDSVTLANANVRADVTIRMGGGDDDVSVDETLIGGSLAIGTGTENDTVTLGGPDTIANPLVTRNGTLEGALAVRNAIHVDLGSGNDMLTAHQAATFGSIGVHGGLGDDTISANVLTATALAVLGDEGLDTITLDSVRARYAGVLAGAGNDHVTVRDSMFTSLGVALGEGDDTLSLGDNEARIAVLLGGAGEDTLEELSENDFTFEVIRGFEVPPDANSSNISVPPRLANLLDRLGDVSEGMLRELLTRFIGRSARH